MTRLDRRSVIAALGVGVTGTLAGCGVLGGDEDVTFSSEAVESVLSESVPEVDDPVPVSPADSAVQKSIGEVDRLLDVVPSDMDDGDVPNGVIRRRIRRIHGDALERRYELSDIASPYRKLQRTRRLRRDAGEAAWAYGAVEGTVSLEGARTVQDELATKVEDDLSSVEYVGDDRDRALYVAVELESDLRAARNALDYELKAVEPSPLDIGELGGNIEYARGTRFIVSHLATRHRARLTDSRSFADAFERALDRTLEIATDRSLPERGAEPSDVVQDDISETPAAEILSDGIHQLAFVRGELRDVQSAGRLGIGLREAYTFERDVRAYESVRDRVEDGELRSLDVAAVRQSRERALELVSSNPVDPSAPTVPADLTVHLIEIVRHADEELRRAVESSESVGASALQDLYAKYVWTAERLATLSDAVDAMDERFDP